MTKTSPASPSSATPAVPVTPTGGKGRRPQGDTDKKISSVAARAFSGFRDFFVNIGTEIHEFFIDCRDNILDFLGCFSDSSDFTPLAPRSDKAKAAGGAPKKEPLLTVDGVEASEKKRVSEREKLIGELSALAVAVQIDPTKKNKTLIGLSNPGSSRCYLNASLQTLAVSFGHLMEPQFSTSFKKEEGEADFGGRVLNALAKVEDLDERVKNPLLLKKGEAEEELNKEDATPDSISKALKNLLDIENDLREPEDRALFKQSFLLFLRARAFGTKEQVEKAATIHKNVCFHIKRGHEFLTEPTKQKDAASYFELFHHMFSLHLKQKTSIEELEEVEKKLTGNKYEKKIDSIPFLRLDYHKGATLRKLIARYFGALHDSPFEIASDAGQIKFNRYWEKTRIQGSPPEYVTVHIKRFGSDLKKIQSKIPLGYNPKSHAIDLGIYFPDAPSKKAKDDYDYDIVSLVQHSGEAAAGHYVAYVKVEERWYLLDDQKVEEVAASKVPFDKAYLLTFGLKKATEVKAP